MKISVAICTYNGEKYIKKQINSILSQTVLPDEIVLFDDCSTDNTVAIVKEMVGQTAIDLSVHINDVNQGCGTNFVNCYSNCTGDIIFSCDQDDMWISTKIEKMISYFENDSKLVLAFSNADLIDADDKKLGPTLLEQIGVPKNFDIDVNFYKNRLFGDTYGNFLVYGCCYAFRKDFFDKLLPFPEKWYFDSWIAICAPVYGNVKYINESLILYRQHGANHSGSIINNNTSVENKSLIQSLKETKFNKRFKKPSLYFEFYTIFYDVNKQIMNESDILHINKSIDFYKTLSSFQNRNRVSSMFSLIGQYFKGNFKHYRGNWKLLMIDILYLFVYKK